jgi:hypothetical protein
VTIEIWSRLVELGGLFFSGLLAGEEVLVRFGVRQPLTALGDAAHIQMRQGLIRSLRILVPATYIPTVALAALASMVDGAGSAASFRWVALAALGIWTLATLFGTVPINAAALEWAPEAPPRDWKMLIDRWERLNTLRTWCAIVAFAALLTAVAPRLTQP